MKITEVRIFKTNRKGAVLAYANVVLDDQFIIRGITLIENEKGRFISMPSRRLRNEKKSFRNICHPLNNDIRVELTNIIFEAYEEFLKAEK